MDESVGFTWWMLVAPVGSILAGGTYLVAKLLDKERTLVHVMHAIRREAVEVTNIALIDLAGGLLVAIVVAVTGMSGPLGLPGFVDQSPFWGWLLIGSLGPLVADHTFVGRLIGTTYDRLTHRPATRAEQAAGSIARAREASVMRVVEGLYAVVVEQEASRTAKFLGKMPQILRSSPQECEKLLIATERYFSMTRRRPSRDVRRYIAACRSSLDAIVSSPAEWDAQTPEDLFERSYALGRRLLDEGHWRPVAIVVR